MATSSLSSVQDAVLGSWSKISPFWPLKNLVAVNPVGGFEDLPFDEALDQANAYFQQKELPESMKEVNRESIKWLQPFFDDGQSTIKMPLRESGFLKSILRLMQFDRRILKNKDSQQILEGFCSDPHDCIPRALALLSIKPEEQELFFTLLLTTLPGWAAHVKYRVEWACEKEREKFYPIELNDYLAFRLIVTCLLWPQARELLSWYKKGLNQVHTESLYQKILKEEDHYQRQLVELLKKPQRMSESCKPQAQFVFCIDVRSEPFRRTLEAEGPYKTYGFAGFFGLPISIQSEITEEHYPSCPVLLKPIHKVVEKPIAHLEACKKGYKRGQFFKGLYHSLKYSFTTPFFLVDCMGMTSGFWMLLRTFAPLQAKRIEALLKGTLTPTQSLKPDIHSIPFGEQVAYAGTALKMMGLTEEFAPLVFICGHRSLTENNPYATKLDCGACGGRQGGPNASILAAILNTQKVRLELKKQGIEIPEQTTFLAAEHNTTTDEMEIYEHHAPTDVSERLGPIKKDLEAVRLQNSYWRSKQMGAKTAPDEANLRAKDWAEVRPEWGLARNAAFIIGSRALTEKGDLQGRAFLHSYEWKKDKDGKLLSTIIAGPVTVAYWINSQYLFSTIDNVAFGAGSKITSNITGKIGTMQGNASDLMHGLPLQSVYQTDHDPYHQAIRLTVVICAPKEHIEAVITGQPFFKKLIENGWIKLMSYDPESQAIFCYNRGSIWQST